MSSKTILVAGGAGLATLGLALYKKKLRIYLVSTGVLFGLVFVTKQLSVDILAYIFVLLMLYRLYGLLSEKSRFCPTCVNE